MAAICQQARYFSIFSKYFFIIDFFMLHFDFHRFSVFQFARLGNYKKIFHCGFSRIHRQ